MGRWHSATPMTNDGRLSALESEILRLREDNARLAAQLAAVAGPAAAQAPLDFRVIADAIPIPVVISRLSDGQLVHTNTLMTRMFGLSREEFLRHRSVNFYGNPADRQRFIEALTSSPLPIHFEIEAPPLPGMPAWVGLTAQQIVFDGGPAIFVCMIDITTRKQAEQALRASEELYHALFDSSPFPTFMVDVQSWAFLAVNDATCRHYGYAREELLQKTIRDIRAAGDEAILQSQVEASLREQGPMTHKARHLRKDGTILQVEVTARPVMFRDRMVWISTIHDVTDRMLLESQLQQSQKLESVARLAGGIAHDFNNLLTAILGYTELLEHRFRSQPDAVADLGEIRTAGMHARELTQQLLAFARRQSGDPRVIDLSRLLLDRMSLLCRLAGEGIEVTEQLAPDLWSITADPGQFEQVLINLVLNARDAMGGRGTLTLVATNRTLDDHQASLRPRLTPGDYVLLEIRDTGGGMSPEVLSHVFEPFFSTKADGAGTGLGLAAVYGIMTQGGGDVWVGSEVGVGTSFTLAFPRAQGPVADVRPAAPVESPRGTETILLVEDNAALRSLTSRMLEEAGYRVTTAESGPDAIELAARASGRFRLLITDVVMPHMSGKALAERLTAEDPHLCVLFVSGFSLDILGRHGVTGGSGQFLAKPFTETMLLSKVRELLDVN